MKSLFVYVLGALFMGGGCLLLVYTGLLVYVLLVPLFLISTLLGISHFIPKFRSKSLSPLLPLILGVGWLVLSSLFLFIIGAWTGLFLSFPDVHVELLLAPGFLPDVYLPFLIIWALLSILISISLLVKKPFWLVERKAKYIQILGVLLCLVTIMGIRNGIHWIVLMRDFWHPATLEQIRRLVN